MAEDAPLTVRDARPEQEDPDELAWINARYDEVGFQHSSTAAGVVVVEYAGERAGVGRLVRIGPHVAELGGILVLEAFRGRGLAGRIVEALLSRRGDADVVYCLPFAHLQDFYARFGFAVVDPASAVIPPHVRSKLDWCGRTYDARTLLMQHAP